MNERHRDYLFDLGYLLRDQALDAKKSAQKAMGTEDETFQTGRLVAYHEVISLLISQAITFNLPMEDLHLNGLEPDRDLLCTVSLDNSMHPSRPELRIEMVRPHRRVAERWR